ncbi:MAG: XrtB/PEP-CTERM-associated polysaccharide biosynthesis outer membrane protein EpsL [Pseudomonadota bacterium]
MTTLSFCFPWHAARAPRLAMLAALAGACAAPAAMAAPSDALHIYAGVGYFHDDNLFRLPQESRLSDSARYGIYGMFFDRSYSRQKIYLQAKLSKVKFSSFDQLDYDGKDLLGLWNWELGNRFEGSLGATYEQSLAPYIDFRSRERNLRVHKRQHADGAWKFHPAYRVRAGAARDTYRYELEIQRFHDRSEDMVEVGFDYTPRSGSTAGLVARRIKGKYDVKRIIAGAPLNDDFTQDELKVKVNWKVTGITSIGLLAGYARRRHEVLGARDESGLNGRMSVSMNPRKKIRLNAALWREFAPIESTLVTYSLNRGVSVGATWDASAKLRVDASASRERRGYEGRLAGTDAAPVSLKDTLSQASLGATWSLRPTVQLNAALTHQRRTGAAFLGNGSFKSNLVSVNVNAQF